MVLTEGMTLCAFLDNLKERNFIAKIPKVTFLITVTYVELVRYMLPLFFGWLLTISIISFISGKQIHSHMRIENLTISDLLMVLKEELY